MDSISGSSDIKKTRFINKDKKAVVAATLLTNFNVEKLMETQEKGKHDLLWEEQHMIEEQT